MIIIPKDPYENLAWRAKMNRRAGVDLMYRESLKRAFNEDILFAFNAFFYTLDVRKRPFQDQPFCTYGYQDEAILALKDSINNKRDEVWEKSRDMGATWCILMTFFWFWLGKEGTSDFLVGSRKEDYVDRRGDPRTLFAKIRYAYKRLPKWLRPKGFNPRLHDTYMKWENPETGSTITGESNNPAFSTAGRYTGILYDEFAKWESTDKAAWTAGGDASPCRVANSTPFGAGGQYYGLVTDGKTRRTTMHWSRHPEKAYDLSCVWPPPNEDEKAKLGDLWEPEEKLTSSWYAAQCERRDPVEVAQELDIDYLGSGDPVFSGSAWRALKAYHKMPETVVAYLKLQFEELAVEAIKEPLDKEGTLLVYELPRKDHWYTMGVDVVEGVEDGDYATVVIYNRNTKSVDAFYWSRIDEVNLARIVYLISRYFSPQPDSPDAPWCGIETTGPGLATFDFATMLGVTNLFMAPRFDVVKGGVSYKKGWRTDTNSRNELVAGLRKWLGDRAGKLNSHRLCGELMTFVRSKTGKPIAKAGCHDDAVMAFGIAIQVDEIMPQPWVDRHDDKGPLQRGEIVGPSREQLEVPEPTPQEICLEQALVRRAASIDLEAEDMFWGQGSGGRYY